MGVGAGGGVRGAPGEGGVGGDFSLSYKQGSPREIKYKLFRVYSPLEHSILYSTYGRHQSLHGYGRLLPGCVHDC